MSQATRLPERSPMPGFDPWRGVLYALSFRWFSREGARRRLRIWSYGLAPVAGALIPLSTSAAEVAFGTLAGFWLIGGVRERGLSTLLRSPVGVACLVLYAWLTVASLWADASAADSLKMLVKYRAVLYVAILLSRFEDQRLRRLTSNAFLGAMIVTLAASWLMWFGVLTSKWGNAENCAYFKNHIAQNTMMAFAAFLLARSAVSHRPARWLKILLACLCIGNVLFMVDGRTGYLIVGVLLLYFAKFQLGWRGLMLGLTAGIVAAVSAYTFGSGFRERIDLAVVQARGYLAGEFVDVENSVGLRLQFYETSLALAAERPLFGHGTGGFEASYTRAARARFISTTRNPHNEYLMMLVQGGLVAVLLLLALFVVQWREAATLSPHRKAVARALVLTIAIGCLFNSLLLDKTEGSFFALFSALCFAKLPPEGDVA